MEFVVHFPILLNILGHVAGVTAFGGFLLLLARNPKPGIGVAAVAAALALCWNAGSLVVLLTRAGSPLQSVVATGSMVVLSILPCTLLHVALQGDYRWLNWFGFALGAGAAAIHLSNAVGLSLASPAAGIDLIRYGFSAVAVVGAVLMVRRDTSRRSSGMRFLAAMALFLLAASFVHFGEEHEERAWLHELVFHHAGIPLALFVMLQDYRFLLLDVFVRLAGASVLAAAFAGALLWFADSLALVRIRDASTFGLAAFVIVSGAVILSYPWILGRLGAWVENSIFRRKDVQVAARRIRVLNVTDGAEFLERAVRFVAEFASAARWKLMAEDGDAHIEKSEAAPAPFFESLAPREQAWAEAVVPIQYTDGTQRILLLGPRDEGRRYLSIDLSDLDMLAAEINRRNEQIRRDEQGRLMREAEMMTLRAQINPHFLFNALNALNAIIPASANDARRTLLNLADIFRYSLGSKRQFVPLAEEMEIVEAYLQIERLRFGKRLTTRTVIDESARQVQVPALSIQPLVENAVKHGISQQADGGEVAVLARREGGWLQVEVIDNGPGFDAGDWRRRGHGLASVERRLQLSYAGDAELIIHSASTGTRVGFRISSGEHASSPGA